MLKVNIKRSLPGFNLIIDFAINQEILAILGPSGSGKTMTLKCIAGLYKPDEGHIELNGKVLFDSACHINLKPQQRKVGFVFQNYALFPHLTVSENIAYGIHHLPKEEVNRRVSWLLDKMGIQGLKERYPRQLSSGQQQRTALARALSNEPEVLLLDEPFSALDTMRRERLEFELLSLQDSYKGDILFVTHDLTQGFKLGSKIGICEAGRMVQCDSKRNVISAPLNRTAARLTGVKNLMEGRITSVKDSDIRVNVPVLGETFRVRNGNIKNISMNQQVTVGIRPEYVRITDHETENTTLCTLIQLVEEVTNISCYFQANTDRTSRYPIEVKIPKSEMRDISCGQLCYLCLTPEHLTIIPE